MTTILWRRKGEQFLDASARPLAGGKLQYRHADTDNVLLAFKDQEAAVVHTAQIMLNAGGSLDDPIYLETGASDFKEILLASDDTQVFSSDDYPREASSGGGGGVTDHGGLTGLEDDDHPQYHNNARGDARYALIAEGVPAGGTTGQILAKASNDDNDTEWIAAPSGGGGGVTDGDKGDIVVSSSGATWTIDAAVLTTFGRSLTGAADAGAARTALGLGSAATADTGDFDAAGAAASAVAAHEADASPHALMGVNATADTTNRLSVASPASLFSHAGTGGHQQKINKATAGDTASQLYQTGFSGRAEVGLTGDDDFHFKVSPDGTNWFDGIIIDKDTGEVSFPNTTIGGGGGGGASIGVNVLINGDFQVNQRVFGGGALSAGAYGFDRWKAATGGANCSVSGFTVTLSSGELEQVVEPSLWGYASFASLQVTISVDTPSQDLTVTFGSQSGTITAGSGRRSVTLTLGAGDTGNRSFKIKRASGSGVTFGRVKLEVGAAATDWQARDRVAELMLCRRYWQKTYELGTAVGSVTEAGSIFVRSFDSTRAAQPANTPFVPPMRATPTVRFYSLDGLADKASWADGGSVPTTGSSSSFVVATGASANGYNGMFSYTTIALTTIEAHNGFKWHHTADAEL